MNYLITFNQQMVRQKLHTHFKFRASCFLWLALLSGSIGTNAQDSSVIAKYKPQLQLIDSVKSYITHELGMYVQSNFYTDWKEYSSDSMFLYFYISLPDRVERDTVYKIPWTFEKDSQAVATAREMTAKGFHTLVYRTAGTSNTLLTPKLLSYPNEAIAFILFHEAVHQNLQKLGGPVHYNYEEALCDAIANIACVWFADDTHMIDEHAAAMQSVTFERLYAFLNKERRKLDTMQQQDKPALYKTCTNAILTLTADANQFVKDRMVYEVNNAYFLRIADYSLNYFKVRNQFPDNYNFEEVWKHRIDFADVVHRIQELQKSQ